MIYIVEDDASIRELEQYALQSSGYDVKSFEEPGAFWQAMRITEPELVILDVMLPGEDGFSILKKLRGTPALRQLPIIMVTAKSSELDTVRGLDCGADDYITNLDNARHSVTVNGVPVDLTYKEYSLLRLLLENTNLVVTRETILQVVWGTDISVESRTVDMHIRTLRKKLGSAAPKNEDPQHGGDHRPPALPDGLSQSGGGGGGVRVRLSPGLYDAGLAGAGKRVRPHHRPIRIRPPQPERPGHGGPHPRDPDLPQRGGAL